MYCPGAGINVIQLNLAQRLNSPFLSIFISWPSFHTAEISSSSQISSKRRYNISTEVFTYAYAGIPLYPTAFPFNM